MTATAEGFGRDVIGPITAEFGLRLWSLGSMLERPDGAATLFCARGGLRMMLAYDAMLAATGLPAPTRHAGLMVSRLAAIRPAIVRAVDDGRTGPALTATLGYEFRDATVRDVVRRVSGVDPGSEPGHEIAATPARLIEALRGPGGTQALTALREQSGLFARHLDDVADGRDQIVLVDTGLFGTTAQLLSEAMPDRRIGSALIARANYRGRDHGTLQGRAIVGLGASSDAYQPHRRRTAILRYWHLIESTFEPDLPSVRTFEDRDGTVTSNLEQPGWQAKVEPEPGTIFAGVMAYARGLPRDGAGQIAEDSERAWGALYRSVVWPTADDAAILDVGARSNDLGSEGTTSARPWRGPLRALRGHALWREGEIARSGTRMRPLLLAAIEAAYAGRGIKRWAASRLGR